MNPHPNQIDEKSIHRVKNLEKLFRKLSAASEATDEQSAVNSLEELFDMGQREIESNPNMDMGEAIDESTDRSPSMASIFKEMDETPQRFGSEFGDRFADADSFQELLKHMDSEYGHSQKTVERMLESNFVDEEWDESLSVGMRILLQLSSDLCVEAINDLSEANNLETAD